MSDSNRIRVSLVEEVTFGTTPTSPTMLVLDTTGQSLRPRVQYQQSQTIRNDANVKDLIRTGFAAGGAIPTELVFPVIDEALWSLMQAALRSEEDAVATNANQAGITGGGSQIDRATGSWITDGFELGDIVLISGASNASDNRFVKLTDVTALTLECQLGDGDTWAATDTSVTVTRGARMKNGTEDRSFSVAVDRLDVNMFSTWKGLVVNGMSLAIADQAITSASFTLEGKNGAHSGSAISGATYESPSVSPVLDSIGVPSFYLGGVSYACRSFGVDCSNGVAARTQVGSEGPLSIRRGVFQATGRIEAYLQTFTEIQSYEGNTPTDLWFVLRDSNSRAIAVSYPNMKWSDISVDTRGLNQDDYMTGSFQAYLDPDEGCTMKLFRFA